MTFTPRPPTLTLEQREALLDSLRTGIEWPRAAKAAGTTEARAREVAARDGWTAELDAAVAEGEVVRGPKLAWADVLEASRATAPKPGPAPRKLPPSGDGDGPDHPPTGDDGEPDWEKIRREAERDYGPGPFGLLRWQEDRLSERDFPRMGDWWLWTIENFYASLKRWLLVIAGRGSGKSTVLTRVASAEGPTVPRRIPPGQTWIWPFVSVRPSDAKRRLHEIREIYSRGYGYALKISSPEGTPTMLLNDAKHQSIAFVSFASTLGNVSGPNSIGATVDEEEKIERDTAEIIGSLIGTFRARAGIRGIRSSSAMTTEGSLYRSVQDGDTITNFVAKLGSKFLPTAIDGLRAVAEWEESQGNGGRGDPEAAAMVRAYASTLTVDTPSVPSWVANPMYGPTPGDAAVALRIEAEGVPVKELEGISRSRYFLREWCSWAIDPMDSGVVDGDWEVCGIESRYDNEREYEAESPRERRARYIRDNF